MKIFFKIATLTTTILLTQNATANKKQWDYACTLKYPYELVDAHAWYPDKYFASVTPNFSAVYLKSFYNYSPIYPDSEWAKYFPKSILMPCRSSYCSTHKDEFYQIFERHRGGTVTLTIGHPLYVDLPEFNHGNILIYSHFTCERLQ